MSVKLPDARAKSSAVNAALRGLEGYEVQGAPLQDAPFVGSPPPPRFPEGATPGSEQPTLQPMFPDDAEVLFPPETYVQDAYEQQAFPQELTLTPTPTPTPTLTSTLTLTLTLTPTPTLTSTLTSTLTLTPNPNT